MALSVEDVLAVGIAQERNAASLYAEAALKTADEACGRLLEALSEMEVGHEQLLRRILKELPNCERSSPDQATDAYLRLSTLSTGPFLPFRIDPTTRLTGAESLEDVLHIAIAFEENAIILLNALKDIVPAEFGGDRLDALIDEEHGHKAMLHEQLAVTRTRQQLRGSTRKGLWSRLFGGK
ncbi:MAG: ferritin family protein [Phycisphaerae bacterium]|nr:ferritin family protein [Phycisphaerae bacterium]